MSKTDNFSISRAFFNKENAITIHLSTINEIMRTLTFAEKDKKLDWTDIEKLSFIENKLKELNSQFVKI